MGLEVGRFAEAACPACVLGERRWGWWVLLGWSGRLDTEARIWALLDLACLVRKAKNAGRCCPLILLLPCAGTFFCNCNRKVPRLCVEGSLYDRAVRALRAA